MHSPQSFPVRLVQQRLSFARSALAPLGLVKKGNWLGGMGGRGNGFFLLHITPYVCVSVRVYACDRMKLSCTVDLVRNTTRKLWCSVWLRLLLLRNCAAHDSLPGMLADILATLVHRRAVAYWSSTDRLRQLSGGVGVLLCCEKITHKTQAGQIDGLRLLKMLMNAVGWSQFLYYFLLML